MNLDFFDSPKTGYKATIKPNQVNIQDLTNTNCVSFAPIRYFQNASSSYELLNNFKDILGKYESYNELQTQFDKICSDPSSDRFHENDAAHNRKSFFDTILADKYSILCNKLLVPKPIKEFRYNSRIKKMSYSLTQPLSSYPLPDSINDLDILRKSLIKQPHKNRRHLTLVDKKRAGILRVIYNTTLKQITELVPLTLNQIRHGIHSYRRNRYNTRLYDMRGCALKDTRILTQELISSITDYIQYTKKVDVKEIQLYLRTLDQPINISLSTIRFGLKNVIGGRYVKMCKVNTIKNEQYTISYRKHVAKELITHMADHSIVIAIDETSFSSYSSKYYGWKFSNSDMNTPIEREKPHKNLTLLMATSMNRIEAITLIENGINQIVFANFIINLITTVKRRYRNNSSQIIILLDNLYVHKTPLIKAVFFKVGVRVLYNAPYSPELNFIENIFQRLKHKYKNETWPVDL